MAPARAANWEEEILTHGISKRTRRAGGAYTGPGSGGDVPQATASGPPPIGFTGGIPDPICLPIDELQAAMARVFQKQGQAALQYGGDQGLLGLREWLAAHWSKLDNLELTPDNFCLTNGSAGALANICETFLDEGDLVLFESPSFPGSIRAIRALGSTVESVPLDNDGLNVDALEEKLKLHKGVYLALSGPNLETRSEYRMLRNLGADVVGMSTVPEVIVAVYAGLKVLGMSVITDECFPDALKPVDIKEILKHANEAEPKMTKIMKRFVETF